MLYFTLLVNIEEGLFRARYLTEYTILHVGILSDPRSAKHTPVTLLA